VFIKVCISSLKALPSNTLKVWSGLSTWIGSSTSTYPFPLPSFPKKLPKILVDAQSFSSFRLISASTVWEALLSANLIVSAITSRITQAIIAIGLFGE